MTRISNLISLCFMLILLACVMALSAVLIRSQIPSRGPSAGHETRLPQRNFCTQAVGLLPGFFPSDNFNTGIKNAVGQSQIAKLPPTPISPEDRSGTREPGWLSAGNIAGGMTVLNPDLSKRGQRASPKDPLPQASNVDPDSAVSIQKIFTTDMQKSLAGEFLEKPLQVMVRDAAGAPVQNVSVRFKVKSGGGELIDPITGSTAITATDFTDDNGIAEVRFKTGLYTSANATCLNLSGVHSTQVDLNIIEAWLDEEEIYIKSPFTAYGLPGPPVQMKIWPEGIQRKDILSFAGSVAAVVQDANGNPVSNVEVIFTSSIENGECIAPDADNKELKFVSPDEPCLTKGYPEYAGCGFTDEYHQQTGPNGSALIHVILGAVPRADYIVKAVFENKDGKDVSKTATLHSTDVASWVCYENFGPGGHLLVFQLFEDDSIYCGAPDDKINLRAHLQLVLEREKKDVIVCSGGRACNHIYGIRKFTTDLKYDEENINVSFDADIVFNNDPGKEVKAGNIYTYTHTVKPGVNTIPVTYKATVTRAVTYTPCVSCRIISEQESYAGTKTVKVYGIGTAFVDDQGRTVSEVCVPVNEDCLAASDVTLFVQVMAGYTPVNCFVVIYENDVPVSYIPAKIVDGQGGACISRGSGFDETRTYTAAILINKGGGESLEMETPATERLKIVPVKQ